MATWNATELAEGVLIQLGVLAAGQTASAEDTKVVTDTWASIHPQLLRFGLAPFASTAIPVEFQEPLVKYVSGQVSAKFGLTGAREATIMREGMLGWTQIQEQAGADRTILPVRPDFY